MAAHARWRVRTRVSFPCHSVSLARDSTAEIWISSMSENRARGPASRGVFLKAGLEKEPVS
jgi:hypothetical protein